MIHKIHDKFIFISQNLRVARSHVTILSTIYFDNSQHIHIKTVSMNNQLFDRYLPVYVL